MKRDRREGVVQSEEEQERGGENRKSELNKGKADVGPRKDREIEGRNVGKTRWKEEMLLYDHT